MKATKRKPKSQPHCDCCGDLIYDGNRGHLKGLCRNCSAGLGGGESSARIVREEAKAIRRAKA